MHSIFQSCLSEHTLPVREESLTERKAGSSLQVIPVLNNFQFRDNRPGILCWPGFIRAQEGWLTLRALLLYSHYAQLHLQLLSQVASIFLEHGLPKRSHISTLCPALVALCCRQLQRKTLFQDTELPFETQHPWCVPPHNSPGSWQVSLEASGLNNELLTNWYC